MSASRNLPKNKGTTLTIRALSQLQSNNEALNKAANALAQRIFILKQKQLLQPLVDSKSLGPLGIPIEQTSTALEEMDDYHLLPDLNDNSDHKHTLTITNSNATAAPPETTPNILSILIASKKRVESILTLSTQITKLKREQEEGDNKLAELKSMNQQMSIDIRNLERHQRIKKNLISNLEKEHHKKNAARIELNRLRQAKKEITEAISIMQSAARRKKIPSRSASILLFLSMLGVGLTMILSNRRFNSLRDGLSLSSYSYSCEQGMFSGGGTCDSRVSFDLAFDGTCGDQGIPTDRCFPTDYDYILNDPCPPLIDDLCSFKSGVLTDQLSYFLLLGLGGEGVLLLTLALHFGMNFFRSCDTKCGELSAENNEKLQALANQHNVDMSSEGFEEALLKINQKIESVRVNEDCRLAFVMASAKINGNPETCPASIIFKGSLGEPRLLHNIFEMADISNSRTTTAIEQMIEPDKASLNNI